MSLFSGAKRQFATYIDQGTVLNSESPAHSESCRAVADVLQTIPISFRSSRGVSIPNGTWPALLYRPALQKHRGGRKQRMLIPEYSASDGMSP